MEISLDVIIKKEGKWYVISDKQFGVTTQGKTMKEAILNFYEAFELCFNDADWRTIHHVNIIETEKRAFEETAPRVDAFVKISTSFWQTVTPYLLQPV